MEEGRKKEEGRESKTLKLCFKGGFKLFACLHFLSICKMGGLPCLAFFLKLLANKVDFRIYTLNGFFQDGFLQLRFPNDDDRPAFCLQLTPDLLVALLVTGDFRLPEFNIGFGSGCVLALLVAVPEVTNPDAFAYVSSSRSKSIWIFRIETHYYRPSYKSHKIRIEAN